MKKARIIKRCILVLLALLLSAVALGACASSGSTSQSSSSFLRSNISSTPGLDKDDYINANVTVYVTETGEKYHRSGCQYLRKSKISISLWDAVSHGYDRCSKCNPPRLATATEPHDTITSRNPLSESTLPTKPPITQENSFTLGSSRDEVKAIMGSPDEIHDYTFFTVWYYNDHYDFSTITFDENGNVKEWSNAGNLNVWLGDKQEDSAPFSLGSSQKQVLDAMGTPNEVHDYDSSTVWYYNSYYDFSTVTFDEKGIVKEWSNAGNLKLE